jgi:hypothetical protein
MKRDWREKTPREFWTIVFREQGAPTHVRIPNADGMGIFLLGWAADLHGPTGKCTCCTRSKP